MKLKAWALLPAAIGLFLAGCGQGLHPRQNGQPSATPDGRQSPAPAPQPRPLEVAEHIQAGDGVQVVKFDNGLTAVVKVNRNVPVVCVRAFVRAGSLFEGPWLGCGISHLVEHLVAEGAEHDMGAATAAEAAKASGRVQRIGAQSNASTSLDYTNYYISATAGRTMECIDLMGDWLARPNITKADFDREHGVVQRELEMGQNEPQRQLWRAHMANAYRTHPAAAPIIGYKAPLAALSYQDVLDYHRMTYVPQNMVVCVVGDVQPGAALERLARAFAGLESGRLPDLKLPEVQPLAGVSRVVRPSEDVKEVLQEISFITIPLVHEDLYALDVLSYVLAEGRASRLAQTVERRKLVTAVSSGSWTPDWGKGLFIVSFRCEQAKADEAEQAVLDELRAVAANGVTEQELARAKRQKIADYVYSQQTVESQSATLGIDYLSTGDVAFSRNYTDRIQSVTAEQVHVAARKYLNFDAMAITRLVPQAQAKPPEAAATQPAAQPGQARTFALPNGLKVVLQPTPNAGLVCLAFVTAGGVLAETEKTNGLGMLMTELSTRGAGDRTAEQINAFFDSAGGSLRAECGNNTFYWQATVLEDSFQEALEILADVIQRPQFSEQELEILRPKLLDAITRQDEGVMPQLIKLFRRNFYAGSPYRMMPAGSRQVVADATAEQIAAYHARSVKASSSVLAVYGQFDAQQAAARIESLLAQLKPGAADLPAPPPASMPADGRTVVQKTGHTVAGIVVAASGMTVRDVEDRVPMDVLDTIISGWQLPSGWLHDELRGKQLVYAVHAQNWVGLAPGAFMVYAQCQPQKAPQVLDIIARNLQRASSYEPTPEEIEQAVNIILTAELLDNQSIPSLALSAALDELYGLGYDFRTKMESLYRAVKPKDVLRVARKYLAQPTMITVTTPAPELLSGGAAEGND